MDRVLQGLWWTRCMVYLDDIISFGSTFDGALTNLTLIFERLRSYGLELKSTKCHLFRSSVPFLGHIVGRHGLECDPTKIEDVKAWPVPDCLKSVRLFLGFVGYYRCFIPNFADVATPLVTLMGKDVPFVWDLSCSSAFAALRVALVDTPILAFPTETGLYILDTDASNFCLGGVLSQVQNDQERVALRPTQRRYCTTKREMLAAVAMCIQFRSYLLARFTLRTDHKSLVWLHCFKDTEGMMARWLHALQQFQFSIVHRPGKNHGNANGLSRAPTSPIGNIPTGHRWDRIAMDILDVCDPTPEGFRYILVIADYFSKWTEAFPMKNKYADTVADLLVDNIILRFGMPLVIHSDQGREFENGLR